MEELLMKLHSFSRQLELEDSIPYWEVQKMEVEARISEMQWNQRKKEQELQSLKEQNLFQNIFEKTGRKKERFQKQIREITTARTVAQWELESIEKRIAAGKRELETRTGSRTAYEVAKSNMVLTPSQESLLMMEEISAFAPAALKTAERILETLENVRFRLQAQDSRSLESLSHTEKAANRLAGILSVLPEGVASIGTYLRSPRDFFDVDAEQTDRLYQAIEQVQTVCNQLRLLLGE